MATVAEDGTVQVAFRIPADLHAALERTARAQDRSLAYTMRAALASYVDADNALAPRRGQAAPAAPKPAPRTGTQVTPRFKGNP